MALVHLQLFDNHSQDLRHVCPAADAVFLCPICFRIFDSTSIDREELSIGHVWPAYVRKGTAEAVHHQVLLCKKCNSDAGRAADASMQEFEKLHREVKSGSLSTPPRTQILAKDHLSKKPIRTGLFIEPKGENTISFSLDAAKTERHRRNNQAIAKRIIEYLSEGPITIIVEPPSVNIALARIGWLTSAYLFAFYTFGYRYILQAKLDEVRTLIRESFSGRTNNTLEFAAEKQLTVARWDKVITDEPQIGMRIPADVSQSVYMRVDFRDVHVRLPVSYQYSIAWDDEPTDKDLEREFFFDGTSHRPHNGICHWEDGFGNPSHIVEGKNIVS
jgi:hypothetical protein